jgi:hypothetical protein
MAALRAALLLLGLAAGGGALAAGGHHAVDDAAILEPGRCELEGWLGRGQGSARLLHAGAGCRVGPAELGVASELARQDGSSQAGWGLGAKWATAVAQGWSVGASLAPAWQGRASPRHQGTTVAALATWTPREDIALHLNLGRDLVHRGADTRRHGIAAEWMPVAQWSFVAERYLEQRDHFARLGARRLWGDGWSVDVSRAQRLRGDGVSGWTLGLSRVLD